MAFIVENLRLKELAIVAEQNKPAFDDLVSYLKSRGYDSLQAFVIDQDDQRAEGAILGYLQRRLPAGILMFDGIARPYQPEKAKWLLLGWVLRDAPEQRLRPMVASMPGRTTAEKQAHLLNKLRTYIATIFPEKSRWEWTSVSEVVIDRLEGSRRAIKGTLFEVIVRRNLEQIINGAKLTLKVSDVEIRLGGETYDVSVVGRRGQILLPVKTRETMGGGHALLFTRDIHKSISVAHEAGFECIPIVIAESWAGDFDTLRCKDHIYINMNPNQIAQVEPVLAAQLTRCLPAFAAIT